MYQSKFVPSATKEVIEKTSIANAQLSNDEIDSRVYLANEESMEQTVTFQDKINIPAVLGGAKWLPTVDESVEESPLENTQKAQFSDIFANTDDVFAKIQCNELDFVSNFVPQELNNDSTVTPQLKK